MRRRIAIAAVIGGLALTGTAMAGGGGPGGLFGGPGSEELAQDLASQLDGVTPGEVEQALDSVAEQRSEERRAEMAAGIAAELDGVDADAVADALAKHEEQVRSAIESGERPDMSGLVTTLSEELGKSEAEITKALDAARESEMEAHKADALKRLDEAVANGDVTDEQADQIREQIENGPGPGGPGGHGPGGPGFGPGGPGLPPASLEGDGASDGASGVLGANPQASAERAAV
jgi:hypothetical protein